MNERRPPMQQLKLEQLEQRLVPSTSTNWSGYAVETNPGAVTAVIGRWVVPAVSGNGTAYSAAWVGIDGYTSATVEQIGTESDVSSGVPTYYAWYELYPSDAVTLGLKVQPGDTVSARVSYSSGRFTLGLKDVPASGAAAEYFSVVRTVPGAERSSAEWIQEAPSSFDVLPLANFRTITFTKAQATVGGKAGPIDSPSWQAAQAVAINMIDGFGNNLDTTSKLTDSGKPATSSFTVHYSGNNSNASSGVHGWGWWFSWQTNLPATNQGNPASLMIGDVLTPATAVVRPGALPPALTPSVPVAPPSQAGPAPQQALPAASGGVGGAGEQAAPDAGDSGDPLTPPAGPDALPLPPALPLGGQVKEQGLAAEARRWVGSPADVMPALTPEQGVEEGASIQPVLGVLGALAMGGYWGIAAEETPRRRPLR